MTFQEGFEDELIKAAQEGNLEIIKHLHENGADLHVNEDQLLRITAYFGYLDIVKYLVEEHGANVHAKKEGALCQAAYGGKLEVVKYLVEEHDADVYADNQGALLLASAGGSLEVVKYLCETAKKERKLLSKLPDGNSKN